MSPAAVAPRKRIDLIDALRGFALVGLYIVHCVEHFEIGGNPESSPAWLTALDGGVHHWVFFLFSGKAYGIFAALFGLSFFIQLDSGARRGEDVRGRLVWRLIVLAAIGYVNGFWYCGDILMMIAVLGLPLAGLQGLSNRVLGWMAAFFLLLVPAWWQAGRVLFAGFVPEQPLHWILYGKYCTLYGNGSLGEVFAANATGAVSLRFLFTFESQRYLQMFGLFLLGLLVGRSRVLAERGPALRFGWRALIFGVVGYAVLTPVTHWIESFAPEGVARYTVGCVTGNWVGFAQIAALVGGFVLLHQATPLGRWLKPLAGYGRMSLTAYMTQSLFWVPIYYGFGFGLYNKLGATVSVLIGLPFVAAHIAAANWWLRRFQYGPMEWVWRACMLRTLAVPFRRTPAVAAPVVAPVPAAD